MPAVRLVTGGQTLILNSFQNAAASNIAIFFDAALSQQITFPIVVGADTTYFYADGNTGQNFLSVTEASGIPLGLFTVQAAPGMSAGVAPRMTQLQLEEASSRPVSGRTPADVGLVAWNYPLESASVAGVALPTAGTVQVVKVPLLAPTSVTNVVLPLAVVGATLTASQCIAGLYGPTGTLLASTASQDAAWVGALGLKTAALVGGALNLQPGLYSVAFFFNGTTGPTFAKAGSSGALLGATGANGNLSAANSLYATADTGRTTTLAATLGALTASSNAIWAGLS